MRDQAARMRALARGLDPELPVPPHVLTVTSGKGGVGKSTIALNLAVQFAGQGRETLLLDADANLASADLMLGLSPQHRLGDVLRGECDLEDALVRPRPGLSLLAGSSGEPDYPVLSAADQRQLLEDLAELERRPEVILVDTGAGLSAEIIGYAELADTVLLVTRPEPTAVLDAYAMVKVLLAGKPDARVRLVVNGVRTPAEADETAEKLQSAVRHFLRAGLEYAGFIPDDRDVARALERREPVTLASPRSAATLSLEGLARRLAESFTQHQRIAV